MRVALIPLLIAALLAVAGCAGGDGSGGDGSGGAGSGVVDPGPVHVHALGVNPADGALFIATHTGLFRAVAGEPPERVAGRFQDTMGFTVVGPDHFLGSGHPDLSDDLPPLLGLIESRDAGETWQPVSLLGEADFHVLRVEGRRVYGFDASGGRLMLSADGGRTWEERRPPEFLVDFVVDPEDERRLVASTERGLVASGDLGRTWTALPESPGLMAWPERGRLHRIDTSGQTFLSTDGGQSWTALGHAGGPPAALQAEREDLIAALHDGTLVRSRDGGRTWEPRAE